MSIGISMGPKLSAGASSPSLSSIFKSGDIGQLLLPQRAGSAYSTSIGTTSITSGLVGLILDQRLGATINSGWLGLDLTPNYWIDATSGNDGNAGTSEGAAWATLAMVDTIINGRSGETTVVRVKAGTYDAADDHANIVRTLDAATHLVWVYEPGCVMDGTAANLVEPLDGHGYAGNGGWRVTIYGNGLEINNYSDATATFSPNGVGTGDGVRVDAYDVYVSACNDGYSAHAESFLNLYRCTAEQCLKSPFLHVGTATVRAYGCEFTEKTGGGSAELDITDTASTVDVECWNTKFTPDGTSSRMRASGVKFYNSHLGTTSGAINVNTIGAQVCEINDSFINVYADGTHNVEIDRCYGKATFRARPGATQAMRRSVISGPASAQTTCFLGTTDLSGAQSLVLESNIFETATAGAFMAVSATVAGYIVASGWRFRNNILSGSAAFDADLVSADSGGAVRVSNVTADALIGAANTTAPADYGYTSGSPAIGAGVSGIDCGFSVDDAADLALDEGTPIGPDGVSGYHAKQATAADRPTLSSTEVTFGAGDSLGTVFPDLGTDVTIAYADPDVGCTILTAQTVGAGTYSGYVDNNGWLIIDRALTAAETVLVEREFDRLAGV